VKGKAKQLSKDAPMNLVPQI